MSTSAGIRAASAFASLARSKTKQIDSLKPPDAPTIEVPDLSHKLSEVRHQLTVLVNVFESLTAEHDERIKSQVARCTSSRRISTPATMKMSKLASLQSSEDGDGDSEEGTKPPKALLEGTDDDVRDMIEERGHFDPNAWYENFRVHGKDFEGGTPLAIAVLRGKREIVHTLIEKSADLESSYSFIAGAEQVRWSGPALHAAIPSGNLDLVRELVKVGADINNVGSNGANLVWQSAYFNQPHILEYSIERGVDIHQAAKSQDNSTLSHSPLHAAAINGHSKVVQILLNARASPTLETLGRQPIEDAIRKCHGEVVKQLMVAKSDIFAPLYSWSKKNIFANKSPAHRCIDMVFDSCNPVLLSYVAQALQQVSTEAMSKADFIRFLSAPGDAPNQILDAIFHRCPLRYWDEVNGKRVRALRTAAFIKTEDHANIGDGPHYRIILKAFNDKTLLPSHANDFMEKLLPQEADGPKRMYVPVTCYMCHIPQLHKDLKALLAIADCKYSQIFSNRGCQAIINLAWRTERPLARLRTLLALIEVLALFAINLSLTSEYYKGGTQLANIVSLVIWLLAVAIEAAQMVGYISKNLFNRYYEKRRYWFDFLVLLLTGSINVSLMILGEEVGSIVEFRIMFGVLTFLKWMRFLTFLRQFKRIGINILPITSTMWDVVPFGIVLSVYMMGSVNLYYALGIYPNLFESFMLVYRLVVLGDMSLAELDNVMSPSMTVMYDKQSQVEYIHQETRVNEEGYYVAVRLFVIFVSFVMGLTMMNLFVAILCLSYSEAAEGARNTFMRSRTGIVLDQRAVKLGLRTILCRRRLEAPEHSSTTLSDDDPEARTAYVWLARQGERAV